MPEVGEHEATWPPITRHRSRQTPFAPNTLYTRQLLHHTTFTTTFTLSTLYKKHLHQTSFERSKRSLRSRHPQQPLSAAILTSLEEAILSNLLEMLFQLPSSTAILSCHPKQPACFFFPPQQDFDGQQPRLSSQKKHKHTNTKKYTNTQKKKTYNDVRNTKSHTNKTKHASIVGGLRAPSPAMCSSKPQWFGVFLLGAAKVPTGRGRFALQSAKPLIYVFDQNI